MAKEMRTKDFTKILVNHGCTVRPGKGSHVVFYCPCGKHTVTVNAGHGKVAPNAMRDVKHRMGCIEAN